MRLLFLVPSKDGHHLEYIEHLAHLSDDSPKDFFIFSIHPEFKGISSIDQIEQKDNCSVFYLSESDVKISKNRLVSSYQLCKLLWNQIRIHHITDVFLIMLMPFGPLLFLPIWGKVKISGILYSLYLYSWKTKPLIAKVYDAIRFILLSRSKNIKSVFVLNDKASARKLNSLYKTSKFIFLVDPFRPINIITSKYKLKDKFPGKTIISHLGFMKERKGSYDILRAILLMERAKLGHYLFVFAGNSDNPLLFKTLLSKAKEKADILYIEGFLDFSEIGELAKSSDLLLLPYHNTNQSSGIIGYGAQFNIPVAVPNENLLGKLVNRFKLGYTLSGHSVYDIIEFLDNHDAFVSCETEYININNVENFIKTIKRDYYGLF